MSRKTTKHSTLVKKVRKNSTKQSLEKMWCSQFSNDTVANRMSWFNRHVDLVITINKTKKQVVVPFGTFSIKAFKNLAPLDRLTFGEETPFTAWVKKRA